MAKQHVRNGRLGRIARQNRVHLREKRDFVTDPVQWWDHATKQWIREDTSSDRPYHDYASYLVYCQGG